MKPAESSKYSMYICGSTPDPAYTLDPIEGFETASSKVRRAVGLVERIIRECKHCTQRKKGMIGLHAAFDNLKCVEFCLRSKHKPKTLEKLESIVWVSYNDSNTDYGQTLPCHAPDELAVTNLVMDLSDLHIAGTIIHEMAHLASGDLDKK